jgi:nitrosocyanin
MTSPIRRLHTRPIWLVSIGLIVLWWGTGFSQETKITLINVLLDGTKIWLPSAVTAKEGEKIILTLVNKLDQPHGFSIPALGVKEVVKGGETKEVEFQATEAGTYPIVCQLHPAHLGGVLIVTK